MNGFHHQDDFLNPAMSGSKALPPIFEALWPAILSQRAVDIAAPLSEPGK
jgi:hypothetical protein